jgi:hypothetical protein
MNFTFTGFFQDGIYRVFSYETLPKEQGRHKFWVRADMGLARRNKIQVQELPLLCRAVLEDRGDVNGERTLTYTSAEMTIHATARATADEKRKSRKPFVPQKAEAKATSF